MRPQRRHPSARGFSLLEVLVTLVIVALIVTLLMQALGQSLDMRSRLLRHHQMSTVASLQEQWFRETVASAMVDLPDGLGRMAGTESTLELVTPHPLGDGGIQRVRWSLQPVRGGMALHYRDATWPDLVVVAGPLRGARFSYLDQAQAWSREWEPEEDAQDWLPRMVRLEAQTATGEILWLVPVIGNPRQPRYLRPQEAADGI